MVDTFEGLSEDEQDELARAQIRKILAKPGPLTHKDVETVAHCAAFIGTSEKMAEEFSTKMLQVAEALVKGQCPVCRNFTRGGANAEITRPTGEVPKRVWTGCPICVTILKVEEKMPKPWTREDTKKLRFLFPKLSPEALLAAFPARTWGSISSKIYRIGLR